MNFNNQALFVQEEISGENQVGHTLHNKFVDTKVLLIAATILGSLWALGSNYYCHVNTVSVSHKYCLPFASQYRANQ